MKMPDLIFCGGNCKEFAEIAISSGYYYGARSTEAAYYPPYFADQNWNKPNRKKHMQFLEKHRPYMASVLDWERLEQWEEIWDWAQEAAQFVEVVQIIPKVPGTVDKIPDTVSGKQVRVAYSVPTRHGASPVPLEEFHGRGIHLLGGSPGKQMEIANQLKVVSVDGNMMLLMATGRSAFWGPGKKPYKNHWYTFQEVYGHRWNGEGKPTWEAFRRSCVRIREQWIKLSE